MAMPVYRKIPLSFGTLVFVRHTDERDVGQQYHQTASDLPCNTEAVGGESTKDPLDLESDSDETSGEHEDTVTGNGALKIVSDANLSDNDRPSEAHSPVVNSEIGAGPRPLPKWPWADEDSDSNSADPDIIGPTIRGTTTVQKPHACEVCGRPFRRRKDIRRHIWTHNNAKPFFCWVCSLTFRSREYLRRHLRRIHIQGSRLAAAEPRMNYLQVDQQQSFLGELEVSERDPAELSPSDAPGVQNDDARSLSDEMEWSESQGRFLSQDRPDEDDVGDQPDERADELHPEEMVEAVMTEADDTSGSPETRPSEPGPAGVGLGPACGSPAVQPRPAAADTTPKKEPVLYLCNGCGSIMPESHVVVLSNKQTESTSKARVLCKMCIIKKTGIICIG